MNAMQTALQRELKIDSTKMDSPKNRLLTRLALAEREYTEGKYRPVDDIIAELHAKSRA